MILIHLTAMHQMLQSAGSICSAPDQVLHSFHSIASNAAFICCSYNCCIVPVPVDAFFCHQPVLLHAEMLHFMHTCHTGYGPVCSIAAAIATEAEHILPHSHLLHPFHCTVS
jgi:hypothetical protein